jgi:hypothetical protein
LPDQNGVQISNCAENLNEASDVGLIIFIVAKLERWVEGNFSGGQVAALNFGCLNQGVFSNEIRGMGVAGTASLPKGNLRGHLWEACEDEGGENFGDGQLLTKMIAAAGNETVHNGQHLRAKPDGAPIAGLGGGDRGRRGLTLGELEALGGGEGWDKVEGAFLTSGFAAGEVKHSEGSL